MNELEINAKFATLLQQRDNALNQVVNLSAELAVAKQEATDLREVCERHVITIEALQVELADDDLFATTKETTHAEL
jgi:EAL domain-containing protein (putative c-di-GMP-specific phosphodiesterase class I)